MRHRPAAAQGNSSQEKGDEFHALRAPPRLAWRCASFLAVPAMNVAKAKGNAGARELAGRRGRQQLSLCSGTFPGFAFARVAVCPGASIPHVLTARRPASSRPLSSSRGQQSLIHARAPAPASNGTVHSPRRCSSEETGTGDRFGASSHGAAETMLRGRSLCLCPLCNIAREVIPQG